jgi:hypothetical protein
MIFRRVLPLLPVLAIFAIGQSCKDVTDPIDPLHPQFAKGGVPGKPPPSGEPELWEFWVEDAGDQACPQKIHMVVKGTFIRLGKGVNHDHFFNAVRDDDPPVETHFEFAFGGQKTPETVFADIEGATYGHADVCFNGRRREYTDESGEVVNWDDFFDYPATWVEGTGGADPFAISPSAVTEETSNSVSAKRFEPLGVFVDGAIVPVGPGEDPRTGITVESIWPDAEHLGAFSDVRSFVIHQGALAPGQISVRELSISNVSCNLTTSRVGKGKDKTTVTSASVSGDVILGYEGSGVYNQYYWGEGHFWVRPADLPDSEGFLSERVHLPQAESSSFSVSRDFGTEFTEGQSVIVEFVVDFLHPVSGVEDWPTPNSRELYDWVYDPGQNDVFTTSGLGGGDWLTSGPSRALDDGKFPVAHSNAVPIVCQ